MFVDTNPSSGRNLSIETLRGLAIVLLVAHHVIGTDAGMGLRLEDGFYRAANDLTDHLRMPLFSILAGFTYALRPFAGDMKRFLSGKFRRLLLPMLIVGTVFAVTQSLTPGANGAVQNWWLLHIIPVSYFWFVESLFLIFLLIVLLETLQAFATPKRLFSVWLLAVVLYLSPLDIAYFSVSGAFYLLPFFLAGLAAARYGNLASGSLALSVTLSLLCLGLYWLVDAGYLELGHKRTLLSMAIALTGCLSLLTLAPTSTLLAWLGSYSYSIFLYHVFFSAALRIYAEKIGLENVHLVFGVSLLAGLLFPIMLHGLFDRHNISRLALLGKRRRPPAKIESLVRLRET